MHSGVVQFLVLFRSLLPDCSLMAPLLLPSGFRYWRFFSTGTPQRPAEEVEVAPTDANPDGAEASSTAAMREEVRRKRREYERSRVFQDIWVAKLPWAESILGADGKVHQVRCLVCTKIEGRDKLLAPKLDTLWKHGGRRKAHVDIPGVARKGEFFTALDCAHLKNEVLFLATGCDTVLEQIVAGETLERKKKVVQSVCIFILLRDGRPMGDYGGMKELMQYLHIPNCPLKHWAETTGWGIAECLHDVVLQRTKEVITSAKYISVSCDEVTSQSRESWASFTAYIVVNWERRPIPLLVTRLYDGASSVTLLTTLLETLEQYGGLPRPDIAAKLVSFGADGVSVFQGVRTGVTVQLKEHHAPFLSGMHCMSHRTNLAVQTLSQVPLVMRIEELLQSLYSFFSHSPKRNQELADLANIVETAGQRILRNVKTRWISCLEPVKRVMSEYKALVLKMHLDSQSLATAKANLNLLCEIELLLGLACILPMLEALNYLVKFSQQRACFVCDMVAAVKLCQADLYSWYVDSENAYAADVFRRFKDICNDTSEVFTHEWRDDMNMGAQTLSMRVGGVTVVMHCRVHVGAQYVPMTRSKFLEIQASVKQQCSEAACQIILELDRRFPTVEVMDALGIVYPQYWLNESAAETFGQHLEVLKRSFGASKRVKEDFVVPALVDAHRLADQSSFFKLSMTSNSQWAVENSFGFNPLSRRWQKLASNALLASKLSEFVKIAEVAVVTILGSVEDERTFSTLNYMKSKVRNNLDDHLDLVVRMYGQSFFDLKTFPM
jgi:hypothetical protein